jgi:hypothetical protein
MEEKYKLWKGNNLLSLLIYYSIGLSLLIGAHHLDPTNLAGPGLDIPAFFVYFILCLALFIKTFLRISKIKRPLTRPVLVNIILSLTINFVGIACLVIFLTSPGDAW